MKNKSITQTNTICPSCKTHFSCGITAGDEQCWCFFYPREMPIPREDTSTERGCLCPNCLETNIMLGKDSD